MRFMLAFLAVTALAFAAIAGDTNLPGRLIVQTDDSAPTCSTASGDGMLCVEGATELQSTIAVAGAATLSSTLAVTGATTLTGGATLASDLSCGDNDITNVGDIALDSISSDGSGVGIDVTGDTLTTGGTDDYGIELAQTLNDTGAAGGSDVYRGIKIAVTSTDVTGWDNVYMIDALDDGSSVFYVGQDGSVYSTSSLTSAMNTGGVIRIRDTTDPGDASGTGNLAFQALDSVSNIDTMARIKLDVTDASDGAEYADMFFEAMTNGTTATEYMRIDSSDGQVEIGPAIASQNADVADSGQVRLGNAETIAWEASPAGTDYTLSVNSDEELVYDGPFIKISDGALRIYRETTAVMVLKDTSTPGDATGMAGIYFQAEDDATNQHNMVYFEADMTDASTGAEFADFILYALTNGTDATAYMRIDSSDGQVEFPASMQVTTAVAAAPSEPVTCDADHFGNLVAVNDTNDTATSYMCYCGQAADDTTYDWLKVADNAACASF